MTTEKNDPVNIELDAFQPASALHERASSDDDEEATIGWAEDDDLDKEGLLSSGGSSPTLACEEFETLGKLNSGLAPTTWQKEFKIMLKTALPLCTYLLVPFLLQSLHPHHNYLLISRQAQHSSSNTP